MADYSIWVLEYGFLEDCEKREMIYASQDGERIHIPYCYVVLKSRENVAMVDVGFNYKDYGRFLADRAGVRNWRDPATVLSSVGLGPADVDTIFITHAHYDHFGNVEDFPKAKFYIQEREIAKWTWVMGLPDRMHWMTLAFDPGDILRGVDLARQQRLTLVDGAMEDALPGIDLHPAHDSHTYGSMWVTVRNDGESWVLAGDLVYLYDNIKPGGDLSGPELRYVPVGFGVGSQTNLVLATEEMMKQVDYDVRRIVPVHEDRIKDHFPSRVTDQGLRVTEICLARGETSRVR